MATQFTQSPSRSSQQSSPLLPLEEDLEKKKEEELNAAATAVGRSAVSRAAALAAMPDRYVSPGVAGSELQVFPEITSGITEDLTRGVSAYAGEVKPPMSEKDLLDLDTDAHHIDRALREGVFPIEQQSQWDEVLSEYLHKTAAEGRKPFSAYHADSAMREQRLEKLFKDDAVSALQTGYKGADAQEYKQRTANIAYLAHLTGRQTEEVAQTYPILRDAYAQNGLGRSTIDDRLLFAHFGGTFQLKRHLYQEALTTALKKTPTLSAWSEARERHKNSTGWLPGREVEYSQQFFQHVDRLRDEIDELRPIARNVASILKYANTDEDLEPGLKMMQELNENQQVLLYQLMLEESSPVEGAGNQIVETSRRGFRDLIDRNLNSMSRLIFDGVEPSLREGEKVSASVKTPSGIVFDIAERNVTGLGGLVLSAFTEQRAITKEEAEAAKAVIQEMRDSRRQLRKLQGFADASLDPIKGENWFMEKMVLPAVGSLPIMTASLVPGYGPIMSTLYFEDIELDRLLDLGVPYQEARRSAMAVGIGQAAVERFQAGLLLGKMPMTKRVLDRIAGPTGNHALRFGGYLAASATYETGTELIQDHFIPALVQDITQQGGDVSWWADEGPVQTAWRAAPDTFLAVFLLSAAGSGFATARDVSLTYEMAGSESLLMQSGYSAEQAREVKRQTTLGARVGQMRELWPVREGTQQTMVAAAAVTQQQVRSESDTEAQAVKMGMIPTIGMTDTGFSLRLQDKVVLFPTYEQARAARQRVLEDNSLSEEKVFGDLASQVIYLERHQGVGREVSVLRMESDVTVDEFARLNPQASVEAFQRNGIENKLTGEDAQATERYILGTSQSEFADKVYRTAIRIAPSGNAQTIIEEVVEGDAKLMILNGMGDQLREWIRALETPENKILADESDMALVEGYARIATAYSLNQRKELEKHGLDPTNLRKMGGGMKGILRNYRTLFGEVFKRSLALRKSMKEGKLTPELEMKLRESLGIEQKAAVVSGEAMAVTSGKIDSGSSVDSNPSFSVASYKALPQRADKPASWDDIKRGHRWASAKQLLPKIGDKRPGFFTKGAWLPLVDRVAKWLQVAGTSKDPWGATVVLANPQTKGGWSDGLQNRAAHLLGKNAGKGIEQRVYSSDKAEWFGALRTTIEDAQVRAVAETGEVLYFRSYKEGVHMVVVDDTGKIQDHYGLISQYAPKDLKAFGDVRVEQVRQTSGLAAQGGPGSVGIPAQLVTDNGEAEGKSQDQTAQTPTPEAQGDLNAKDSESQSQSLTNNQSSVNEQGSVQEIPLFKSGTSFSVSAIARGSSELDMDGKQHYYWKAPNGKEMELLLQPEIVDGRLILSDAHIMPVDGFFETSRFLFGRAGLQQLARDLAEHFGVSVIEIPEKIGRGASGKIGSFGNIRIRIDDKGKTSIEKLNDSK